MKKNSLWIVLLCVALTACTQTSVQSPNGELEVFFMLSDNGQPQYAVTRNGQQVILPSALGFRMQESNYIDGFQIEKTSASSCDETWETVWGEEQFIRNHYNELAITLQSSCNSRLIIRFRVFDDGLAFRYEFPSQDGTLTVLDELTSYDFVQEPQAWSIPWRTEYYEALWTKEPLTQKDTMCSPITLEMADGTYAFLHEAATIDYPAQNFYIAPSNGTAVLSTYLTPWRDSTAREMEVKAYLTTPQTPWRFMILTNTLSEMVASRIMLNLNEPCKIEDTSWIRPMKFMGIWWGMHKKLMTWHQGPIHGATTANMERYLRFAKEHHIGGVLAEGWNEGWQYWDNWQDNNRFAFTTPFDDWDMPYLVALSDQLGVQIVGHNETAGQAGDYEEHLDEAYAYHQANHIHAIKTGYVSPIVTTVDGKQWNKGQSGVRHYRKVVETAAKYQIEIDNHEPVMPSGWQRTYPNLMSQEGVRGQEWNAWSADGGSPCEHVTVLPFTRIMAGPVDYTPGVFDFSNPVIPTTRVHSTLMNQLGLFVCFYSPLQMACDLPESYEQYLDAFQFIEDVPCDWKQSILLDGVIGDYCVFARQDRNSDNWFVGGICDEESCTVTIDWNFLDKDASYAVTVYRDAEDADWYSYPYAYEINTLTITPVNRDPMLITMAPGGGFAISLMKQ